MKTGFTLMHFMILFCGSMHAQEVDYDRRMKMYIVAEFSPAANADSTLNRMQIQREHMAYIQQLGKEGHLVLAGPFLKGGGLFFLNTSDLEEAQKWIEADPSVKNKVNTYTLRQWMTERGLFTLDNQSEATQKSSD